MAPMFFTMVLDFYLAPWISRSLGRKRFLLLMISLAGNFGLLVFFKYSPLFSRTTLLFFPNSPQLSAIAQMLQNVILPAGISFYTFQTLSYIIDVYRGQKPERNFWAFTSFVSFFPHLVAGPLTRHNQLIDQLKEKAEKGFSPRVKSGLYLFIIGLSKKVLIADRIANVIDPWIGNYNGFNTITAWLAMLGYAFQIYFDFSGYTDMALGIARTFDIDLPENFRSPYRAADPSEFWRRWHITLSLWLRDYLYISLGGNRCSKARQKMNLLITMILGGLWHGASWTFAIWGLYHGTLLVLFHQCDKRWNALWTWLRVSLTFLSVCVGWIFFRSESFHASLVWIRALVPLHRQFGLFNVWMSPKDYVPLVLLLAGAGAIVFFASPAVQDKHLGVRGTREDIAMGVLAAAAIVFMNYSSRFLYFQF